jgi:RNA polymerase sigma-70 factor, ECF subfamily
MIHRFILCLTPQPVRLRPLLAGRIPMSDDSSAGQIQPAADKRAHAILPEVYQELRECAARVMRHERRDHTLQPTALVHEAFARLAAQSGVNWNGQTHFMAMAAVAMRRVLLDHARAHNREKRGGGLARVSNPDPDALAGGQPVDVLAVEEALQKLERIDARQARLVELKFYGDLTVDQIAEVLGVSPRTVDVEWAHAKAWLRRELRSARESVE